jgi:hypothetical protein
MTTQDLLRLDRVTLQNFRGHEELSLRLEPDLTVIFGENGSGKTNVLYGIRALLARLISKADVPLTAADAHEPGVEADLVRRGRFPVDIRAEGQIGGEVMAWGRGVSHANGRTTDAKEARAQLLAQRGALPVIAAYGTDRFSGRTRDRVPSRPKGRQRTDAWAGCLAAGASDETLLQWWFEASLLRFQGQPSPAYDAICKAIGGALPPGSDGRSEVLQSIEIALPSGLPVLKYADGRALRWEDLSDGFHALLSLVGDIAWRAWTLNEGVLVHPVTETSGVVLIDEVDLHLHPRWQSQVLPALRRIFPCVQLIVTTHSPLVLASAENHQVRRLRRGRVVDEVAAVHGNDPNSVLQNVQGSDLRPPWAVEALAEISRLIDERQPDQARARLNDLMEHWGSDHPELVRLSTWLAWE